MLCCSLLPGGKAGIGVEGAKAVAEVLRSNTSLRKLNLTSENLGCCSEMGPWGLGSSMATHVARAAATRADLLLLSLPRTNLTLCVLSGSAVRARVWV